MNIHKSKTGLLTWLCIYESGNNYLLNDADLNSKSFQINLIRIINLKTKQSFTPTEFFQKEEKILAV